MYNSIEGVDYIFDRYAFLGLTPQASRRDIEKAVRDIRAGLHPDRLQNLDPELRGTAERKRELVDRCAEILLNDTLRPLYDARLAEFYARDSRLVSKNGTQIIPLGRERFSIDTLLSENIPDTTHLEELIRQQTGFDEDKFAQLRALYNTMSDNPQIRSLYRDALTQQLVYLELLEDVAWAKIGFDSKKKKTEGVVTHADEYLEKVERELARISSSVIDKAVHERGEALRIGVAAPLLLLEDKSGNVAPHPLTTLDEDMAARITKKARANLELRADYVRDIARRKQENLEELSSLSETLNLSPRDPADPEYEIYLVFGNADKTVAAKFNLNAANKSFSTDDDFEPGQPLAAVRLSVRATNAFAVIHNPEIVEVYTQITAAAQRVTEDWIKRRGNPSPAPAP